MMTSMWLLMTAWIFAAGFAQSLYTKNQWTSLSACPSSSVCEDFYTCYEQVRRTMTSRGEDISIRQFAVATENRRCGGVRVCCPRHVPSMAAVAQYTNIYPSDYKSNAITVDSIKLPHTGRKQHGTSNWPTSNTGIKFSGPVRTNYNRWPNFGGFKKQSQFSEDDITFKWRGSGKGKFTNEGWHKPSFEGNKKYVPNMGGTDQTKTKSKGKGSRPGGGYWSQKMTMEANNTTPKPPEVVTIPKYNETLKDHPNFKLLAGTHCGFGLRPRIAFGEEVAPGELPWMAMLRYRENNKLVFRCGGSLISERYVLTAAHCIIERGNPNFKLVSVRLGEVNLDSIVDCTEDIEVTNSVDSVIKCGPSPQNIEVEETHTHPNFSYKQVLKGYPNDIGLIRLKYTADVTEFVMPICLAGLANPEVHGLQGINLQNFFVAGWGMVDMKQDPLSSVLNQVNVSGVERLTCGKQYGRAVDKCQLCAGGLGGNACRGDSGGPLVARALSKNGLVCPLVVGVVSLGTLDCGYATPTIFCDASCYLPWILSKIRP